MQQDQASGTTLSSVCHKCQRAHGHGGGTTCAVSALSIMFCGPGMAPVGHRVPRGHIPGPRCQAGGHWWCFPDQVYNIIVGLGDNSRGRPTSLDHGHKPHNAPPPLTHTDSWSAFVSNPSIPPTRRGCQARLPRNHLQSRCPSGSGAAPCPPPSSRRRPVATSRPPAVLPSSIPSPVLALQPLPPSLGSPTSCMPPPPCVTPRMHPAFFTSCAPLGLRCHPAGPSPLPFRSGRHRDLHGPGEHILSLVCRLSHILTRLPTTHISGTCEGVMSTGQG